MPPTLRQFIGETYVVGGDGLAGVCCEYGFIITTASQQQLVAVVAFDSDDPESVSRRDKLLKIGESIGDKDAPYLCLRFMVGRINAVAAIIRPVPRSEPINK